MSTVIAELESQINDLRNDIADVEAKRLEFIQKIENISAEKKEKLTREKDLLELKLNCEYAGKPEDIYGIYDVRDLGPILAHMTTIVTGEEYIFTLEKTSGGQGVRDGRVFRYKEEVANIRRKNKPKYAWRLYNTLDKLTIATSGEPDFYNGQEINLMQDYESHFKAYVQIARFSDIEGTFNPCFDASEALYIKGFINYVTSFRVNHKKEEISYDELQVLERDFLMQYHADYEIYRTENATPKDNSPICWDDERNIYCKYNLEDLGPVLAQLLSEITGRSHEFDIVSECMTVYESRNDGDLQKNSERAVIKVTDTSKYYPLITVVASGKEKVRLADEVYLGCFDEDGYSFSDKATGYFRGFSIPNELVDYIRFVTDIRLKYNLTTITKEKLEELKEEYLIFYRQMQNNEDRNPTRPSGFFGRR